MDSNVRKTLEREWLEQTRARHEEIAGSRDAVKAEFVNAIKERMAEIKEAAKESRAGKPLGQRIAEASGFNMTQQTHEYAAARRALKLMTSERSDIPVDPSARTFSEHLKADRKDEVTHQKNGFSNYGPSREDWVAQQARERASATGLKPPSREVPQGSPEIAQVLKDQRAERIKALVKDMTSATGSTSVWSVQGQAWAEVATREREGIEAASQFRGREIDASVADRAQQQERAPSRESFDAVAAIQARAEIYKDAAAEMGVPEAAVALSKDDAKTWVDADERQLKAIDNELDAEDAKEAISENFVNAPAYSQEAENAALMQQAANTLESHQARLNEEAVRIEREREVISENAYAAINSRFSDMRNRDVESAGQLQPSDAAELARADVMDLGSISKPELATNAADVIAYNMANSADYQNTVERTLKELEARNSDAAVLARRSVEQGLAAHALREEQMNAREVELQQAADQITEQEEARQAEREQELDDPFGPPLEAPAVNAPADARSVEQEMDRQLTLNEAERLAEKEAVTDADLASVRAANDAAVAARALDQTTPEAEIDPFGPALEEPAVSAPADARSIEQEMDRQLTLNEAERLAEKEAMTDADLASVRAANDAAVAARALDQNAPEAEIDPFGPALDDTPQPVTPQPVSELDAANTIEPVSIREAVNDPSVPVKERDAANEAQNGEEIVLDAQTRAHLARVRAADREAVEQQLGHTGEERRPAPASEQKSEPDFVDRRSRDNQVESDEIMTANRETRKPVLPPEIERQYVSVGTKYYDHKKPDVVAFEDKGNRLETRSNNEEVAANLVKIAESRGWDEIKVSGSETFKKEVWAEAAARGMQVKGYTPTEQDKASLAARLHSRDANKVEPAKSQERASAESPEKQRAESFQKDSREVALKKHPELAGAYAAQSAMQKKMEADRLSPEQQAVVKARVNKNIVNSIEAGKIPEVNRREEVTKHRDVSVSEEREQSR